jgi:integrase/recombinase XerD
VTAALRLVRNDTSGGDELPLLEAYELFMRGAGRAERTVRTNLAVVRLLERRSDKGVEEIVSVDVSRFLANSKLKPGSRASYYGSIASFYKWYGDHGGVDVTARLPRPRAPKGVPHPISTEGLRELLAIRMHRRTRVMILLAALAGLRVHEIAKVRGEDIDIAGRTLRVTGKGSRTEVLPLHPLLAEAAKTMPRRGWWFPGNSRRPGQPIRGRGVTDIISNAMRRADINGTPHGLRHYFGTNLVATGADLRTAQTLLRHASLATTAIYVAVADVKRLEAIDRLDPFGDPS